MNRSTGRRDKLVCLVCLCGCGALAVLGAWLESRPNPARPRSPALRLNGPAGPKGEPAASRHPDRPRARPFRLVSRAKEPDPAREIRESFDKEDGYPAGWARWSSGGGSPFARSRAKSLSAPGSLAVSCVSTVTARAWPKGAFAADVRVEAAVLLDALIPGQVLLRGSGLNTSQPTYYAATVTRGMEVELVRVRKGKSKSLGRLKSAGYLSQKWVRVTLQARGKDLRVRVFRADTAQYLDDSGQWLAVPAWAITRTDDQIAGPGRVGLGRPARYNGTLYFDDFAAGPPLKDEPGAAVAVGPATAEEAKVPALPRPQIPRHYPHIRIAMLAYSGNPMGSFEDRLLRESVDLVVPNGAYTRHIKELAPKTPQLVYTNTSNLYLHLLTDWLNYADANNVSREAAFYHAARPVPFRGDSPSSLPVTWFWAVYRGGRRLTDLTGAAHARSGRVDFGRSGESLLLGYHDRFREINLDLASGARGGWAAALEYVRAVDADGRPTDWAALPLLDDATDGLHRSGRITFDPPADWKPAAVGTTARLYHLRFRTTRGGFAPTARTILGRDYVGARGTTSGVVPAFDAAADRNHDGYLDDAEYARRSRGKDARFAYESRMLTESYGQMRFSTNPSHPGFRAWAVKHHVRLLRDNPVAAGLFMDNCDGKPPVAPGDVLEPVGRYAQDYGAMLNAISRAVAPHWVLANANGHPRADPVVRYNPVYMLEFAIRPLSHHYGFFEDLAATVERRARLVSPPPLAVIDSHPQRGSPTDPRMQLATLAYYYLISDPDSTFLMFFGGFEPASTWRRHWVPAAAHDIGRPTGKRSQWATGADPANRALTYRVYQRPFAKALVLYKPLSYARGSRDTPALGDETATTHDLPGAFRPLGADGTLGTAVRSITLRNGEGAILIRD